MARTAVNVLGNCLASRAVVARWEGEFVDDYVPAPDPSELAPRARSGCCTNSGVG